MNFTRITQAPVPGLFDLLRTPFMATPKTDVLSAVWTRKGDIAHWFSRSAWSLVIVARWCQLLNKTSSVTVWVPEYFCDESLTLLRQMGARLVFYPINNLIHPAVDEFPTVTEENRPDIFLLVHYFGEPTPFQEALEFSEAHGAWLVEDAAHVQRPIAGVGMAGDFVLYSPHKHLAIPDGAVLVVRESGPAALGLKPNGFKLLDGLVRETASGESKLRRATVMWLVKRLLQRLGVRPLHRLPAFAVDTKVAKQLDCVPEMSVLAKRLLVQELPHLSEYESHRTHYAAGWARVIQESFPAVTFQQMSDGKAPYLAYVTTADQAATELLYTRLLAAGVPVTTWPDLPHEVIAKGEQSTGRRLLHTRVYLPVHQSLSSEQIADCGNRIRRVHLSGWRLRQIYSKHEWESLWLGCRRKSLPQTWEYGSAKAMAEKWQVKRFVVLDGNELPTALFQVLIKGVPSLGGAARVNRGPIMLGDIKGDDSSHLPLHAIEVLVRESIRHRWWMMQIAPLLPPNDEVKARLRDLGFRKQPICPMDSAFLSLECGNEALMMGFKGKWRNCLRKGQKLGVTVKRDDGGQVYFAWLIDLYCQQQQVKHFDGVSARMLQTLANKQSRVFKFNLYVAFHGAAATEASLLGVLVTLQFGDVSEYLIGATNDRGRASQANSVLLWEAILDAKRNGCRWFDVGGLAQNTPKGIADFKQGLNPKSYALVGEWRRWF